MEDETQAKSEQENKTGLSFVAFILSLAHTAAVHFGDVQDPTSGGTTEANLVAAQQMIDILALLDQKTRGNLSAEERQFLEQILFELRMRYIEARKGGPSGPSSSGSESPIVLP